MRRFQHKRERYEAQATVVRCKVCAQHCETSCSGCRKPVCLRHNAASATSLEVLCLDCFLIRLQQIRYKTS
jgi:hypothetical protein